LPSWAVGVTASSGDGHEPRSPRDSFLGEVNLQIAGRKIVRL
jgi:hypothetical protein